jgi:hypothetical protein
LTRGRALWVAIGTIVLACSLACARCPEWVPPLETSYVITDAGAEELIGGTLEVSNVDPIPGLTQGFTFVFTYVREGEVVEVTYFQAPY